MKTLIIFLVTALISSTLAHGKRKTCDEAPEQGECDAYFPKWYYHPQTQHCYMFVYGGCRGNGNRYDTEQECLDNCKKD
ncbi:Kunitz-type kappaPI-theraphotoxin-Hs1a like protein [Argiope bruennichi]|uniref:Kunitz-type kappaPI-theraphotoxin-Hs1a like protein n=1 Tax=Argiope bruennichi TaxID=94029 RepID=A0A8T0E199_ARGBR|nr:Kunitz-type kappaPI-theraphotoxin-Hs1a like protein [Argiope bruennichi]